MNPPSTENAQSTSLQRLHHVEKRIVHVLELAGGVMEELGNATGPRMDVLNSHCLDFMQSIKNPITSGPSYLLASLSWSMDKNLTTKLPYLNVGDLLNRGEFRMLFQLSTVKGRV
ncbi:uncharacterized protein LOC116266215 isoform X2 [Nymphaea colorata]|uniref:uncharacterized protein LOC116266215 isoform X2 n=1 Tax=Nymphaea colorata TaxID=210225 RepID=UPI00129EFD3A|nr:uncharacterized protein LOC116266215 isoform X2 [Nymphaea colorata]